MVETKSMNMPKISIIVPVYKAETYLHRCVDSILAQTFTDWELLLIDDGSPDRSGEICDEYAKKDTRIRVFHKKNGGVSSARNLGLDNVLGEYVTFVDSDDCLYLNALDRLFSVAEKYQLDFIQCSFNREYKEEHCNSQNSDILSAKEYVCFGYLGTHVWASFFKTDIIKKYNLKFDTSIRLGEDQIFAFDYLLHTQKTCYIGDVLYFYMDNDESAIHNPKPEYEIESVKAFKALKNRNPLAQRQCDDMVFAWFKTLCQNNAVSIKTINNLYKDIEIDYCSPRCNFATKLLYQIYKVNKRLAVVFVKLLKLFI